MARINSLTGGFIGLNSLVNSSLEPEYFGATMVFAQSTTPAGWVKDTSYNDFALRVVSGTGGVATTSNQPFSTVFATSSTMFSPETGTWPVGATGVTTLSISQIAPHTHAMDISGGAGLSGYTSGWPGSGPGSAVTGIVNPVSPQTSSGPAYGSGGGHSHTSGTVTAITYSSPFNFNVKYKDVILATYN